MVMGRAGISRVSAQFATGVARRVPVARRVRPQEDVVQTQTGELDAIAALSFVSEAVLQLGPDVRRRREVVVDPTP